MITRDLREAIGRAVAGEGFGGAPDPGLRPGHRPGQYASSVAFALRPESAEPESAGPGSAEPGSAIRAAERIAARLRDSEPWIETATVTGRGFITVTVTAAALRDVARRMAPGAGHPAADCARSDALRGRTVPAGPAWGWDTAATWEEARRLACAEATARLAEAAGADLAPEPAQELAPGLSPAAGEGSTGGGGGTEIRWEENGVEVSAAVAFAGRDAARFFLLRAVPGSKISVDQRNIARHLPGNPAYAVRYAHARAASGVRWAVVAAHQAPADDPQRPSADPGEPALLDALSWLPERVATSARRGRPDEFARYLEQVAEVTLAALASPKGGQAPGSDRLALAVAARTGLAAGLDLLGVNAPERL